MSLCVSLVSVCVCVHVCCLSICLLVRNCRILWPLGFDRIMAAALLVDISPNAPTETQPAASGAVYTCVCVYIGWTRTQEAANGQGRIMGSV